MDWKKGCLSLWAVTLMRFFQGFSFSSHWCQSLSSRSALLNFSRSFMSNAPHLLSLWEVCQFTRQCPPLIAAASCPFQNYISVNSMINQLRHKIFNVHDESAVNLSRIEKEKNRVTKWPPSKLSQGRGREASCWAATRAGYAKMGQGKLTLGPKHTAMTCCHSARIDMPCPRRRGSHFSFHLFL
jgi:hypothetical protein